MSMKGQPHSPLLLAEIAEMAERAPHLDFREWFVSAPQAIERSAAPAAAVSPSGGEDEGASDA